MLARHGEPWQEGERVPPRDSLAHRLVPFGELIERLRLHAGYRFRRDRKVRAKKNVRRIDQTTERGHGERRWRERRVEIEPPHILENARQSALGNFRQQIAERQAPGDVGQKSAGMGQNKPDPGVALDRTGEDEVRRRARRVRRSY